MIKRDDTMHDAHNIAIEGQHYCIRHIPRHDSSMLRAYQQLRAEIFVKQLGWNIPVDADGCERDRYDQTTEQAVSIYGVTGITDTQDEYLLGGIRIFELHGWHESMIFNEFVTAEMIPAWTLQLLEDDYQYSNILELSRFCTFRGRSYHTPPTSGVRFSSIVVRDLTYAAVYRLAENTGRCLALALVDPHYFRIIKRSHFVFREIYSQQLETPQGYALTMIDLVATIRAIQAIGNGERAERMTVLCNSKDWIYRSNSLSIGPIGGR
jgi:N-acyl-L-homoserine lactone synthetase